MKNKLILENRTDLPMEDFLEMAIKVIRLGRISNKGKQYCHLFAFTRSTGEYHVVSTFNKKSDTLILYKQ
jgi:hypothetical protein